MKNKKIYSIGFLFSIILLVRACGQSSIKVNVINADGTPVAEANVEFIYVNYTDDHVDKKTTNKDGFAQSSGKPLLRSRVDIEKDGYYSFVSDRLDKNKNHELTVTLKKVVNPIPLFAKKTFIRSVREGMKIGYDFELGDWVKPYGKGINSDILLDINMIKHSNHGFDYDYSLLATFPSPLDGLQEFKSDDTSKLRSPHQAPENGYLPTWLQTLKVRPDKPREGNRDPQRNYWLRVRSKVDENGDLLSAHYVKIYGDFPEIQYYFNPTPNDRNLEFDPTKNLLKGLNYNEDVYAP